MRMAISGFPQRRIVNHGFQEEPQQAYCCVYLPRTTAFHLVPKKLLSRSSLTLPGKQEVGRKKTHLPISIMPSLTQALHVTFHSLVSMPVMSTALGMLTLASDLLGCLKSIKSLKSTYTAWYAIQPIHYVGPQIHNSKPFRISFEVLCSRHTTRRGIDTRHDS
jgi:hypothetical protein